MTRIILFLAIGCWCAATSYAQDKSPIHYVCIMSDGTYHDRTTCALLQMCTGAKYRKTSNVSNLKPCKKCARPILTVKEFNDIKRVLGVKDRKQIKDSLGTAQGTLKRNGYTLRILGAPDSKTVNTLEFFFSQPTVFNKDSVVSSAFLKKLDLQFDGCQADTIRNQTTHPVTGAIDQTLTIEYRGCAIVEQRQAYDDVSKYFYRLTFIPIRRDRTLMLEKITLVLDVQQ